MAYSGSGHGNDDTAVSNIQPERHFSTEYNTTETPPTMRGCFYGSSEIERWDSRCLSADTNDPDQLSECELGDDVKVKTCSAFVTKSKMEIPKRITNSTTSASVKKVYPHSSNIANIMNICSSATSVKNYLLHGNSFDIDSSTPLPEQYSQKSAAACSISPNSMASMQKSFRKHRNYFVDNEKSFFTEQFDDHCNNESTFEGCHNADFVKYSNSFTESRFPYWKLNITKVNINDSTVEYETPIQGSCNTETFTECQNSSSDGTPASNFTDCEPSQFDNEENFRDCLVSPSNMISNFTESSSNTNMLDHFTDCEYSPTDIRDTSSITVSTSEQQMNTENFVSCRSPSPSNNVRTEYFVSCRSPSPTEKKYLSVETFASCQSQSSSANSWSHLSDDNFLAHKIPSASNGDASFISSVNNTPGTFTDCDSLSCYGDTDEIGKTSTQKSMISADTFEHVVQTTPSFLKMKDEILTDSDISVPASTSSPVDSYANDNDDTTRTSSCESSVYNNREISNENIKYNYFDFNEPLSSNYISGSHTSDCDNSDMYPTLKVNESSENTTIKVDNVHENKPLRSPYVATSNTMEDPINYTEDEKNKKGDYLNIVSSNLDRMRKMISAEKHLNIPSTDKHNSDSEPTEDEADNKSTDCFPQENTDVCQKCVVLNTFRPKQEDQKLTAISDSCKERKDAKYPTDDSKVNKSKTSVRLARFENRIAHFGRNNVEPVANENISLDGMQEQSNENMNDIPERKPCDLMIEGTQSALRESEIITLPDLSVNVGDYKVVDNKGTLIKESNDISINFSQTKLNHLSKKFITPNNSSIVDKTMCFRLHCEGKFNSKQNLNKNDNVDEYQETNLNTSAGESAPRKHTISLEDKNSNGITFGIAASESGTQAEQPDAQLSFMSCTSNYTPVPSSNTLVPFTSCSSLTKINTKSDCVKIGFPSAPLVLDIKMQHKDIPSIEKEDDCSPQVVIEIAVDRQKLENERAEEQPKAIENYPCETPKVDDDGVAEYADLEKMSTTSVDRHSAIAVDRISITTVDKCSKTTVDRLSTISGDGELKRRSRTSFKENCFPGDMVQYSSTCCDKPSRPTCVFDGDDKLEIHSDSEERTESYLSYDAGRAIKQSFKLKNVCQDVSHMTSEKINHSNDSYQDFSQLNSDETKQFSCNSQDTSSSERKEFSFNSPLNSQEADRFETQASDEIPYTETEDNPMSGRETFSAWSEEQTITDPSSRISAVKKCESSDQEFLDEVVNTTYNTDETDDVGFAKTESKSQQSLESASVSKYSFRAEEEPSVTSKPNLVLNNSPKEDNIRDIKPKPAESSQNVGCFTACFGPLSKTQNKKEEEAQNLYVKEQEDSLNSESTDNQYQNELDTVEERSQEGSILPSPTPINSFKRKTSALKDSSTEGTIAEERSGLRSEGGTNDDSTTGSIIEKSSRSRSERGSFDSTKEGTEKGSLSPSERESFEVSTKGSTTKKSSRSRSGRSFDGSTKGSTKEKRSRSRLEGGFESNDTETNLIGKSSWPVTEGKLFDDGSKGSLEDYKPKPEQKVVSDTPISMNSRIIKNEGMLYDGIEGMSVAKGIKSGTDRSSISREDVQSVQNLMRQMSHDFKRMSVDAGTESPLAENIKSWSAVTHEDVQSVQRIMRQGSFDEDEEAGCETPKRKTSSVIRNISKLFSSTSLNDYRTVEEEIYPKEVLKQIRNLQYSMYTLQIPNALQQPVSVYDNKENNRDDENDDDYNDYQDERHSAFPSWHASATSLVESNRNFSHSSNYGRCRNQLMETIENTLREAVKNLEPCVSNCVLRILKKTINCAICEISSQVDCLPDTNLFPDTNKPYMCDRIYKSKYMPKDSDFYSSDILGFQPQKEFQTEETTIYIPHESNRQIYNHSCLLKQTAKKISTWAVETSHREMQYILDKEHGEDSLLDITVITKDRLAKEVVTSPNAEVDSVYADPSYMRHAHRVLINTEDQESECHKLANLFLDEVVNQINSKTDGKMLGSITKCSGGFESVIAAHAIWLVEEIMEKAESEMKNKLCNMEHDDMCDEGLTEVYGCLFSIQSIEMLKTAVDNAMEEIECEVINNGGHGVLWPLDIKSTYTSPSGHIICTSLADRSADSVHRSVQDITIAVKNAQRQSGDNDKRKRWIKYKRDGDTEYLQDWITQGEKDTTPLSKDENFNRATLDLTTTGSSEAEKIFEKYLNSALTDHASMVAKKALISALLLANLEKKLHFGLLVLKIEYALNLKISEHKLDVKNMSKQTRKMIKEFVHDKNTNKDQIVSVKGETIKGFDVKVNLENRDLGVFAPRMDFAVGTVP